jgi:hypothetical protein
MKKLENQDLIALLGGQSVSREEFCAELKRLMQSGTLEDGAFDGASIAYAKECAGRL